MNNGYSPFKPAVNAFSGAWNTVKNAFTQLGSALPKPGGNSIYVPPGQNVPDYYQIKPGDTYDTIASQYGMDVKNLQDANKQLVVPPKGSYIKVARPGFNPMAAAQSAFQQSERGISGTFMSGAGQARQFTPTATLQYEVGQLSMQLQNGVLPPQVTARAATSLINPQTGTPFTPQDFLDSGYIRDASGNYVQPGTPGAGLPQIPGQVTTSLGTGSEQFMNTGFMQKNLAQGTDFVNQLRWDPSDKKYKKIGQLIREGKLAVRGGKPAKKRRSREDVPAPVAEATNAGATPSQQLAVLLGGG